MCHLVGVYQKWRCYFKNCQHHNCFDDTRKKCCVRRSYLCIAVCRPCVHRYDCEFVEKSQKHYPNTYTPKKTHLFDRHCERMSLKQIECHTQHNQRSSNRTSDKHLDCSLCLCGILDLAHYHKRDDTYCFKRNNKSNQCRTLQKCD